MDGWTDGQMGVKLIEKNRGIVGRMAGQID